MLRHHLLLTYRNFQRFRSTFIINLIGLSTGLCCVLLIYLWVNDELQVDKFHEKDSQLYQVMENQDHAGDINTSPNTPDLLAQSMLEDIPEIEQAVTVYPAEWFGKFRLSIDNAEGNKSIEAEGQFVSPAFFDMFSYKLLQGDEKQVLEDKKGIVISEDLAMSLFGTTENVVGKSLEWHLLQFSQPAIVSGIFAGTPRQSSAQFDFALTFEAFNDIRPWDMNWGNTGPLTYISLQKNTDLSAFNDKIEQYIHNKDESIDHRTLFVRPYADAYLYGNYEDGKQAGGRIEYVRLFSIIAIFILLIACINFMNLSTAKASRRVKEVGIKKAIGAGRSTLVFQYLSESIFMTLLSLLLAILLATLLMPQFNLITGKHLSFDFSIPLLISMLAITLITGLIAGSYPALYLSGFKPAVVLKGKLNSSVGEVWARKGLVVFQFSLSVILIVSVWVVYQQITFVQNKNLGFDKENLLSFPVEGEVANNIGTFVDELKRIPGVINASSMRQNVIGNQSSTVGLSWPGKDPEEVVQFQNFSVNYDMIETLGLKLVDGRSFRPASIADTSAIIFNETAIKMMGLENPVGSTVNLWGEDRLIIGVVQDFHYESLHEKVKPIFFKLNQTEMMTVIARLKAGEEQQTLAQVQEFYKSFNPAYTFDYQFVDTDYQALYEAEQRVSTLSKYFAGLAILISCLGLFGLAAFTAERRLKEIGIRKILGSDNFGIVYLLSTDFTKMVLTAVVIALPLSYYLTQRWLQSFAFQIELAWWIFVGAGLIALFIAWFTVGIQTIKAARVNPVQCLKDE